MASTLSIEPRGNRGGIRIHLQERVQRGSLRIERLDARGVLGLDATHAGLTVRELLVQAGDGQLVVGSGRILRGRDAHGAGDVQQRRGERRARGLYSALSCGRQALASSFCLRAGTGS